jgi:Tetratricopeptide repeat
MVLPALSLIVCLAGATPPALPGRSDEPLPRLIASMNTAPSVPGVALKRLEAVAAGPGTPLEAALKKTRVFLERVESEYKKTFFDTRLTPEERIAQREPRYTEAAGLVSELASTAPDDPEVQIAAASVLIEMKHDLEKHGWDSAGLHARARQAADSLASRFPKSSQVQGLLGSLYTALGEPEQALRALARAVELSPEDELLEAALQGALKNYVLPRCEAKDVRPELRLFREVEEGGRQVTYKGARFRVSEQPVLAAKDIAEVVSKGTPAQCIVRVVPSAATALYDACSELSVVFEESQGKRGRLVWKVGEEILAAPRVDRPFRSMWSFDAAELKKGCQSLCSQFKARTLPKDLASLAAGKR